MVKKLLGVVLALAFVAGSVMVLEAIWSYPERGTDAFGNAYVQSRGAAPQLHEFVNDYIFVHTHPWLETPAPTTKALPASTSSTEELLKRADALIADRQDPVVNVKR